MTPATRNAQSQQGRLSAQAGRLKDAEFNPVPILKRLAAPGTLLTAEGQRMAGYSSDEGIVIHVQKLPEEDRSPPGVTVVIASALENSIQARNAVGGAKNLYPNSPFQVFVAPPDFVRGIYNGTVFRERRAISRSGDTSQIEGRILTWVADAALNNASDMHFWSDDDGAGLAYRIDGLIYTKTELDPADALSVMSTIFYMAKDQSDPSYSMQHRHTAMLRDRLPESVMGGRCSWAPLVNQGRSLVIRLLYRQDWSKKTMGDLYLPSQYALLSAIRSQPYGMVVWGGPVGSGKSTSVLLYILENLRACGFTKAATSIEDPVEYVVPGIRQQTMTNSMAGMSRGQQMIDALKGVLRQDQNILNIGETRDLETAELAVHAARSGLFVITTTHANFADEVPLKMQAMGLNDGARLDPSAFIGFVNQRLARKLCPACSILLKDAARHDAAAEDQYVRLKEILGDKAVARMQTHGVSSGCPHCSGRGYKGRMALGEVIAPDEDYMRKYAGAISSRPARDFWLTERGGVSMQAHGLTLALQGLTSVFEIERLLGTCSADPSVMRLVAPANDGVSAAALPLAAGM